jgi:hypothetical protein
MSKFTLTLAALGTVAALQAHADTAPAVTVPAVDASVVVVPDTDENGSYSFDEVKLAYPEVTEEAFKAADTDADGVLSADELKAAEEAKTFAN